MEDLIRQLSLKPVNSRGWEEIACECCHDYQTRGGFRFDPDEITYSCWNCGTAGKYQLNSTSISNTMRGILNSFGIPNDEINMVLGHAFFDNQGFSDSTLERKSKPKKLCKTEEVELPLGTTLLSESKDSVWKTIAEEFIESRGLGLNDASWCITTHPKYQDRLIIPFYRGDMLVYWQARSYLDVPNKYLNSPGTRENIVYGFDEISKYAESPLFVTEGVMDAISIGGVALIGSSLNECKLELLHACRREIVFVIDKDNNGKKLGNLALDNGWAVSCVDGEVRDVNSAVQDYGKLWTIGNIMTNIRTGVSGKGYLNVMCRDNDEW